MHEPQQFALSFARDPVHIWVGWIDSCGPVKGMNLSNEFVQGLVGAFAGRFDYDPGLGMVNYAAQPSQSLVDFSYLPFDRPDQFCRNALIMRTMKLHPDLRRVIWQPAIQRCQISGSVLEFAPNFTGFVKAVSRAVHSAGQRFKSALDLVRQRHSNVRLQVDRYARFDITP